MSTHKPTADDSFLVEYKERAESGEIIIGQELYLELINLVNEMDEYEFDREDALIRIDFIEKCVKLTKDPYYGKPMQLMLWQKAFIEALFSYKMPTGERRFIRALLEVARKNGKSELCSALILAELILGNAGSDIVASSNNDEQSRIIYNATETMRKLIDPRDLDTKKNISYIINKWNDSRIFRLSDKVKTKEGFNISTAILDEVHELKDNSLAKVIEQSQSMKFNKLMLMITTDGFIEDGFLDGELKKARAIIRGEADDPASKRYLPWLYTMDSELEVFDGNRDNRLWMKANPTLGVIKKWDYMEEQVALARQSKGDKIFVLSKDFNIKQAGAAEAFLDPEDFSYEMDYDLDDFKGAIAIGAVDLAETTDLCAASVLMMRPDDNHKYIYTHYFIPESKLGTDVGAGARYEEWVKGGYIHLAEGNDNDLADVADWFYSLYKEHDIRVYKVGYDQRFAKDWLRRMDDLGWAKTGDEDSELIMINQNAQTLSNAIRLLEADFKKQYVMLGDNPVDRWCLSNAGLKVDDKGFGLIVKREREKRIDGAVCMAILYETYRRLRTEFKQVGGF